MRAAQVSASASGRQLHGFFPGVVNGESGVFATRSADGVAWERPVRLLASEEIEHRTQDHPVGLHAHAHWMISSIFIWDQSIRWVASHRCANCHRANHTRSSLLMHDPAIAAALRALERAGPKLRQLPARANTTTTLAWDTAPWRDVAIEPFNFGCKGRAAGKGCELPVFAHIPGSSCQQEHQEPADGAPKRRLQPGRASPAAGGAGGGSHDVLLTSQPGTEVLSRLAPGRAPGARDTT